MKKSAGRKPFGYYDDELAVIEVLFIKAARRPHGKKPTFRKLADSMNADKLKTQAGKPWYPIAVGRILIRDMEYYRKLRDSPEKEEKPQPKKKPKPVAALTQKEIDKCRRYLVDSDRMIYEVLLGAGLRATECCNLLIKDVNIYDGNSYIEVQLGKGAKPRNVKIDSFLKEKLTVYLLRRRKNKSGQNPLFLNEKGGRLTYSNLYDRIIKLKRRAGIKYLYPHKMRHTFAAHLYHYTKSLKYVQEQLGHASIAITQIYINTLDINKLDMQEMFGRGINTKS